MNLNIYSYFGAVCLLLIGSLVSCSDDVITVDSTVGKQFVFKERNPNYPWIPYSSVDSDTPIATTKAGDLGSYLGYAWKGSDFFDSYSKYITYPVIDVKKAISEGLIQYDDIPVYEGRSNRFSYATFDNYSKKSTTVKKISTGIGLNLGLFSIGSKKTMAEIFGNSFTSNSKAIFGELNVQYESRFHKIQYSSVIADLIVDKYLNKNFIRELYCTTPNEFVRNYGRFVLTNYILGGKASVLYSGIYNKEESEETKESNMDREISASYGFKVQGNEGNVSGSLGVGRKYNNGQSSSGEITSLNLSVKTIGGSSNIPIFTAPTNIDNIDINMDAWLSSLSNSSNLAIIDIEQNGLVPITDFVIEKNLKQRVLNCINGVDFGENILLEPYITYSLRHVPAPGMWLLYFYLNTRYNDKILLSKYLVDDRAGQYVIDVEKARFSEYFGVKFVAEPFFSASTNRSYQLIYDSFNPSLLKKVIDPNSETIYLLNDSPNQQEGNSKYAYTIRVDKILDDYVMRSFINTIPTIQLNLNMIKKEYVLFAL